LSKVFIVYAHPEPRSLNGSLRDLAVRTLSSQGHEVRVSDLYAMRFKAVADADDFTDRQNRERLFYNRESSHAFASGTQTPDVSAEQEKLLWADAVIFQFPLWWFSMPAILKGWVERVYARGFAYAVGTHGGGKFGIRYGDGALKGRRSMISITVGGKVSHYAARGVNGALGDLLFHIQHGTLYYPGMDVLPPFVVYESVRLTEDQYKVYAARYADRLRRIFQEPPIPYRPQNDGEYDEEQSLLPGLGAGASGTDIHIRQRGETAPAVVLSDDQSDGDQQ
jgi:NAD(P)H dehydrogenase (quinone)